LEPAKWQHTDPFWSPRCSNAASPHRSRHVGPQHRSSVAIGIAYILSRSPGISAAEQKANKQKQHITVSRSPTHPAGYMHGAAWRLPGQASERAPTARSAACLPARHAGLYRR
jgi:hypothetical protein